MFPCSWIYEDGDEMSLPVDCTGMLLNYKINIAIYRLFTVDKETAMAGVHICVKSHIYMYRSVIYKIVTGHITYDYLYLIVHML